MTKGNWTTPSVLSIWGSGLDGADGTDGNEFEYVFAVRSSNTSIPLNQRPLNTWTFDQVGTTSTNSIDVNGLEWHDGAVDVTAENRYLWRCTRKVPAGTAVGTAVTDEWSLPSIVGAWGNDGVAGKDGGDGQGWEYAFAITASDTALTPAQRPSDSWGFDQLATASITVGGVTWSDGGQQPSSTRPYLWRAQRMVPGGTRRNAAVSDPWDTPIIISTWGSGIAGADGEDGADGENGVGTEYIFTNTPDTVTSLSRPPSSWKYDEPGTSGGYTWTDGATSLRPNQKQWRAERRVSGSPSKGATVTPGTWSTPVVVAAYGQDGAGKEYIYCRVPNSSSYVNTDKTLKSLLYPLNSWTYQQTARKQTTRSSTIRTTWFDDRPQALIPNRPLIYVSERNVVGNPARNTPVSDNWTTPSLVFDGTGDVDVETENTPNRGVYFDIGSKRICVGYLNTRTSMSSSATTNGSVTIGPTYIRGARPTPTWLPFSPTVGTRYWSVTFPAAFRSTPVVSTTGANGVVTTTSITTTGLRYRIAVGDNFKYEQVIPGTVNSGLNTVYFQQSHMYIAMGDKP